MMKKLLSLLTLMIVCISGAWAQNLDRTGWTILASSACNDGSSGQVNALTDGNTGTFWHSNWGGGASYGVNNGGCPHAIQIDLADVKTFYGVQIQNRTDGLGNGRTKDYAVYVSNTPFTESTTGFSPADVIVGDPVLSGTFNDGQGAINKAMSETEITGRYVLFVINDSYNQGTTKYACIAEINLIAVSALDNWKAEITALENLVGGYTTDQIATLSSVTSTSQIDTWLANNSKIAFDENKYYRVWNKSRSEVTKAAWDLHESSVAWYEYDGESKTQVWQFKNTGATGEYKYKIQNIGNPAAFMPAGLGGNSFHAFVNEADAGVFAITEAGTAQYQVHHSSAIGSYVFADASNHLDGWKGDGKDLWYLEITEIDDVLTTITWNVVDEGHNVIATQTLENCAEGSDYTTTLGFAYTTLNGNTTVTATKENQTIELTYTINSLPFTASADFATATWYKMTNASRGKSAYYDANEENILVAERAGNDWANLWALIGNPISGYQLVNKAAGEGLYLNAASAANAAKMTMNATATTFTLVEGNEAKAGVANTIGFKLGSVYVNDYSNAGFLSFWQDSPTADQGSNWLLTEVTVNDFDWAGFETLLNSIQGVTFGDALGQYTLSNKDLLPYVNAYISQWASMLEDKESVLEEDFEDAMMYMEMIKDDMTLNMPEPGAMIRIKDADNKYMTCENTSNKTVFSSEKNDLSIYCYTGNALIAYTNGYYASRYSNKPCGMSTVTTESEGTIYHIHASPLTKGKYLISFGGDTRFMYKGADAGNYAGGPTTVNNPGYEFTLEEVETLPVAVSAAGYATLYAPVALEIPENVTAYTLAEEGDYLLATEVSGTIPANTGVIIKAAEGTHNFAITTGGTGSSCLRGTVATAAAPAGVYTLAKENDEVGFYSYTGETVKGFRAYFEKAGDARSFGVIFGEETGIKNVELNSNANAVIYNLAGQRVNKAEKGIYIINGKKVLK